MSKYIKIKLPTDRELYINRDNITVISEDPTNKEKTELYMSDGIRYLINKKILDILALVEVNDK